MLVNLLSLFFAWLIVKISLLSAISIRRWIKQKNSFKKGSRRKLNTLLNGVLLIADGTVGCIVHYMLQLST